MIKIEMAAGGINPTVLCNICEHPIRHHSEGVAVYQGEGSLVRFHHVLCAEGGFTEHWPSVPVLELLQKIERLLGLPPG